MLNRAKNSPPETTYAVSDAQPPIWWSNGIFFMATHLCALYGTFYASPLSVTPRKTLILAVVLWQLSCLGVTIGYHRLYSHRAFNATTSVRVILAALGSMAFQGSIKWWCLRHRLHHRFTDDPVHDPYAATRGLLFSHMGWIFFRPSYERMASIDKLDLERDPVVRYQHKHYVTIALFFGLVMPPLIGSSWGDIKGAFIWGGLVARVITWHCTFLVNSFAHWDGLQNYSDEVSARGNMLMALFTCGEGNHNFHAFPHDFRAGPASTDWDPSKWIIMLLYYFGLANRLRRARYEDIKYARQYMQQKSVQSLCTGCKNVPTQQWEGPFWDRSDAEIFARERPGRCVLIVDEFILDVTSFMKEHPGGAALLRTYSLRMGEELFWQDASGPFKDLNNHSKIAQRRMRELRVAKLLPR